MKNKLFKWIGGLSLLIILVFILLNPNMKQFQEFLGDYNKEELKKVNDFMIFSTYEDDSKDEPVYYTGIFMNFVKR